MAWYNSLKDLVGDVKHVVPGAGSLVGSAALGPFGSLIGSGVEGSMNGKGILGQIGSDLGKGAVNAGAILGASELPGIVGSIPGLSSLGGLLKGGLGSLTSVLQNGGSALLGSLGDLLKSGVGGSGVDIPDLLLGGLSAFTGAKQMEQGDKERAQAINDAQGSYDARAPFRTQGASMALNATKPDLSSIFADPGDPYATPSRFAGQGNGPLPVGAFGTLPPGFSPAVKSRVPAQLTPNIGY